MLADTVFTFLFFFSPFLSFCSSELTTDLAWCYWKHRIPVPSKQLLGIFQNRAALCTLWKGMNFHGVFLQWVYHINKEWKRPCWSVNLPSCNIRLFSRVHFLDPWMVQFEMLQMMGFVWLLTGDFIVCMAFITFQIFTHPLLPHLFFM